MSETSSVPRITFDAPAEPLAARLGEDRAHAVKAEGRGLETVHRLQVALDQFTRHVEARRRGESPVPGHSWPAFLDDALTHAARLVETLEVAAGAARGMLDEATALLKKDKAMSKKDADTPPEQGPPQLTTSGEPHPLVEGGYDAASDPQVPGNISDVEALKEGKTTRAQAEALAAADTADADEDDGKKKPAPKGHKKS